MKARGYISMIALVDGRWLGKESKLSARLSSVEDVAGAELNKKS